MGEFPIVLVQPQSLAGTVSLSLRGGTFTPDPVPLPTVGELFILHPEPISSLSLGVEQFFFTLVQWGFICALEMPEFASLPPEVFLFCREGFSQGVMSFPQ